MLTIWDSQEDPGISTGIVYTWNGYVETERIFSLFRYVDKHDHLLKKAYLQWIYELGEYRVAGIKIHDHLALKDGFSFWWMTLFVEKDAWKQPAIMSTLRLMALADILQKGGYKHVRLVSGNKNLATAITSLCKSLRIQVEVDTDRTSIKNIAYNWYSKLPVFIRSGLSMGRFLIGRWRLRKTKPLEFFQDNAVFFCSYFFNLNKNKLVEGVFESRYWGDIMQMLQEENVKSNWLQIYYPHEDIPDAGTASKVISAFNANRDIQGYHFFAEAALSVKSIWFVIKHYVWLLRKYSVLKKISLPITVNTVSVNPWPLLEKDWKESLVGPTAVHNLFFITLFEKLFSQIPQQKKGIFLFENQSWDKALIHFWRKFGHGTLIAVPHSTVRYWDFRYFTDTRVLNGNAAGSIPFADKVAVNGGLAKASFCSMGFPEDRVVECEALRYMGLNRMLKKKQARIREHNAMAILLLGDYQPEGTANLLRVTAEALQLLPHEASVVLKPHPNHITDPGESAIKGLTLTIEPLENIILDFDIVISGNTTSASVDAYLAGLPVFVLLDDTELNFNPLRGCSGVYFIDSPLSLKEAICNNRQPEINRQGRTFFHLDDALPKWRRIIA